MSDLLRSVMMGLGCLSLLWISSCAIMGATTVAVVGGVSKKAGNFYEKEELKWHNDRDNNAAAYHEHSDYEADYYENYED